MTYTWYNYELNEKGRTIDTFKHFSQREIKMIIYKEPEEKLVGLLDDPEVITKVHITNNLLLRLYRHGLPKRKMEYEIINARTEKLGEQFKTFFEERLQAHMYEERAFNCPIEDIKFLSLSMAGRLMITLDTPNSQITFKGIDEKEGDSRMGTNSIDASINEAERITNAVIESCNKRFEKGETFADIFQIGKVEFAGQSFGKKPKKAKKAEQPA
jgi:hypothetical protein